MGVSIATLLSIFDPEQTILEGLFATSTAALRRAAPRSAIDECRPALAAVPA